MGSINQLTTAQKLEAVMCILESVPMYTRTKFCSTVAVLACELATKERLKRIDGKEKPEFCIFPLTGKNKIKP